jgi:ATP synthase protein I
MTDNLKGKLNSLNKKVENIKNQTDKKIEKQDMSGLKYFSLISVDLLAGIGVGGFLGYYLDVFFQSKPLCFIIFMLLGLAGGFLNIFKRIK